MYFHSEEYHSIQSAHLLATSIDTMPHVFDILRISGMYHSFKGICSSRTSFIFSGVMVHVDQLLRYDHVQPCSIVYSICIGLPGRASIIVLYVPFSILSAQVDQGI